MLKSLDQWAATATREEILVDLHGEIDIFL